MHSESMQVVDKAMQSFTQSHSACDAVHSKHIRYDAIQFANENVIRQQTTTTY